MVARDGCARSTMRIRVKAANVPKKYQQLMGEGPRPFSIAVDSRNGRLWNPGRRAPRRSYLAVPSMFIREQCLCENRPR
jgi:hypothetical protein